MSRDGLSDAEYSMREGEPVVACGTAGASSGALPRRFFPNGFCNPGFEPPSYLMQPSVLATIEPPAVVKTWEQRFEELTTDERAAFVEFRAWVEENKWDQDPHGMDTWETLRFLIARQFNLKKAKVMVETHVKWLIDAKPKTVVCGSCASDQGAHMQQFVGWDKQHRPVMYMSYKQCKDRANADNATAHNLMVFEAFKEHVMPMGVEQWINVTDFVTYSHWKDGASGVGRKVLGVMQDHYPERLAIQYLVDPPTTFWVLFKALSPFIDAKTREKVRMVYTAAEPNIKDEFPKVFPPHVSDWLIAKYLSNKGAAPPPAKSDERDVEGEGELDAAAA